MSKDKLMSVAEYAAAAGLSKNRAYKALETQENKKFIVIVNGVKKVSSSIFDKQENAAASPAEDAIAEAREANRSPAEEEKRQELPQQTAEKLTQEQEIKRLQQEIEELKKKVEERDKKLIEYADKFAELAQQAQTIAGQAQILQAKSVKELPQIEDEPPRATADIRPAEAFNTPAEPPRNTLQGFTKWLFRKR